MLKNILIQVLRSIGKKYDLDLKYDDAVKDITKELITSLANHKKNMYKKVVILIYEYNSPILNVFNTIKKRANQLVDLTLSDKLSEVYGFANNEIEITFESKFLEEYSNVSEIINKLKKKYNGYS
ncbi:hypothetical protein C1645_822705 [Glomus cerebriforme]|uniref:Uncharacterized protein n=1 Tax=Glomus cerebriforme TaxID=658196 RepID=A0A397T475_9GLOM|nr:hypothetical protein C1645_822705 [Glomus cerebriforme]